MSFEVVCAKTGRWWSCWDMAHGMRLARRHGLVDFEVGPLQQSK